MLARMVKNCDHGLIKGKLRCFSWFLWLANGKAKDTEIARLGHVDQVHNFGYILVCSCAEQSCEVADR